MPTFEFESVVRGHHVYKDVWNPTVGEELEACREPENAHDRHAVTLKKAGEIIGHVPHELCKIMYTFTGYSGHLTCRVAGRRKLGKGLEVPCVYVFCGKKTLIS